MRAVLIAGVSALALTAFGSAVWAEGNTTTNHQNMRSNLTQMLQKSGYTDIRVAPTSFVVRARDGDGNPVVMSISPGEFTEVTDVNSTTGANANNANNSQAGRGTYVNVATRDDLSSKLVGLDITNNDNKTIGTIKDIALNPNGREAAYIVSVGGFLGMGEHYVAVNPSAVNVSYDQGARKWHSGMNATADQLKAAPEFKYAGRWSSSG